MIPLDAFIPLVCQAIPRFQVNPPNARQQTCILYAPNAPLMIVAGPGSGKTTVLVLRALRFVFVDGLTPEHVLLTTFTRKAAGELRARLIAWGLTLKDHLQHNPPPNAPPGFQEWLESIDVNRFFTGTLDSICEDVLTTDRDPADPVPVLVEGFVGNALLMFQGLFPNNAHNDPNLDAYLSHFTRDGSQPANFRQKLEICRNFVDRFNHDLVDLNSYLGDPTHAAARTCVANSANSYWQYLDQGHRMDFARLETVFLDRLVLGRLGRFVARCRAVLVDEYQDTNPLQERIYFELVRASHASFTIVGDDDQSVYRFRGATVELFRDFAQRLVAAVPGTNLPQPEYLVDNYRSTPEIIDLFNRHIGLDPLFAPARVQPPKPLIAPHNPSNGVPVLGMFRQNAAILADDLTQFLMDIFRGNGRLAPGHSGQVLIRREATAGDFGDCVILGHTVNEFARAFGSQPPRMRLPRLLRDRLAQHGISVFNPRGRSLRDIQSVQELLGTMLECIDPPSPQFPDGVQQSAVSGHMRAEARRFLTTWRQAARNFINSNPLPNQPHSIGQFVAAWQARSPHAPMPVWPQEWPLLELAFKIISWIPLLRDDPEGQVYLEAVMRCIAQSAAFSAFRSVVVFGQAPNVDNDISRASIRRAIMDIFAPLAEGHVEVDEEIMPHVPRSRVQFMTIHQAKGLEFPLVIVDVSSDYSGNYVQQRFRRFPETASAVQNLEDDLASHCGVGPLRIARPAMARTFDDLVRLYYVAFSRPESVLLLVGLDKCLQYRTTIRHVATGWRSDGTWSWINPVAGRPPPLANNIPIQLI